MAVLADPAIDPAANSEPPHRAWRWSDGDSISFSITDLEISAERELSHAAACEFIAQDSQAKLVAIQQCRPGADPVHSAGQSPYKDGESSGHDRRRAALRTSDGHTVRTAILTGDAR